MTALIDANVLVGLLLADTAREAESVALLRRHPGLRHVLAPQSCYEAYVVLTRPASANGLDVSPSEAEDRVRRLSSVTEVLPDPSDLLVRWLDLCKRHAVQGKSAHDARLAAWAHAHGVRAILTLNPGDFVRYGLVVLS